jgi:hypothetical protein
MRCAHGNSNGQSSELALSAHNMGAVSFLGEMEIRKRLIFR